MKSEFTRMNLDFTNLKINFPCMNLISYFLNGFATYAIQFPDHEIVYLVTEIEFPFD